MGHFCEDRDYREATDRLAFQPNECINRLFKVKLFPLESVVRHFVSSDALFGECCVPEIDCFLCLVGIIDESYLA